MMLLMILENSDVFNMTIHTAATGLADSESNFAAGSAVEELVQNKGDFYSAEV